MWQGWCSRAVVVCAQGLEPAFGIVILIVIVIEKPVLGFDSAYDYDYDHENKSNKT